MATMTKIDRETVLTKALTSAFEPRFVDLERRVQQHLIDRLPAVNVADTKSRLDALGVRA